VRSLGFELENDYYYTTILLGCRRQQSFQVRHRRCVDRITGISKMQSNTTVNIYIGKRCFYTAFLKTVVNTSYVETPHRNIYVYIYIYIY
jgi:hypothetical protein